MATLFPFNSPRQVSERQQVQMEMQGYFAENFSRAALNSGFLTVSGTIYFMAIGLCGGDRVTNLHFLCTTLGSGFSGINMRVGLYSKAGVQLATSGDVSASFGSVGAKTCPLTLQSDGTVYTVPSTDAYYAAIVTVGTTPPTLLRGGPGLNAPGTFTGASIGCYGAQTGQTDLTAPAVIAFNTTAAALWVGVS